MQRQAVCAVRFAMAPNGWFAMTTNGLPEQGGLCDHGCLYKPSGPR